MEKKDLKAIFDKLFKAFGPQYWWPADTPFEVIIGAILTQNTNWGNVEKAINNLRARGCLSAHKLHQMAAKEIAPLIKPSGYFNIKAKRLKNFINFLFNHHGGSLKKMFKQDIDSLRRGLLSVNGIGKETADSIILYAAELPIFVVDAYTKRVFSRHKFFAKDSDYDNVQKFFMENLTKDAKIFNEFHALLVRLGKDFCLKNKPKCEVCPIKPFL